MRIITWNVNSLRVRLPRVLQLLAERERLQALLDLGLNDAYRTLHPTEVQYTWWDYRAGHFHKGFGLRIDLALVSASRRDDLRHCGIERNYRKGAKPSDHAPLLVDLADP